MKLKPGKHSSAVWDPAQLLLCSVSLTTLLQFVEAPITMQCCAAENCQIWIGSIYWHRALVSVLGEVQEPGLHFFETKKIMNSFSLPQFIFIRLKKSQCSSKVKIANNLFAMTFSIFLQQKYLT